MLWYIFLVLCCVVPTCCAYRRRRLVEQRMAQQQENFARMQESNFFFLSTLTSRRDGEAVQAERSRVLTDALKDTTMVSCTCCCLCAPSQKVVVLTTGSSHWLISIICFDCVLKQTVKDSDLETLPPSERPAWSHGEIVEMHGEPHDPESPKTEYDIEETDHLRVLKLPASSPNGDRKVPGVCAICLCAYETGDVVAWSAEDSCLHAFHTECLVPWLAKKNEPHCPVCRQSFCKVNYNENEAMYDSPFTFSQSFSQALARARLEASLMSRMESGGMEGDLEIVRVPAGGGLRSSWMTSSPALGTTPFTEPNPEAHRGTNNGPDNSNNSSSSNGSSPPVAAVPAVETAPSTATTESVPSGDVEARPVNGAATTTTESTAAAAAAGATTDTPRTTDEERV